MTIALAGGSWIFLGFIVFMLVAVIIVLYTRKGSGIDQHPYGKIYSGQPGARGESHVSGHDEREHDWSRGTKP